MSLEEILSLLTPANTFGGLGILVLCLSLVQVSPIRINPWDAILGWLGNKTNASVKKTLDEQGKNGYMLCAIDEVLRGTNTIERVAASAEILEALLTGHLTQPRGMEPCAQYHQAI